jgi:ketosteroid isomerase-like protein
MAASIVNRIRSHYREWDRKKGATAEEFLEMVADDASFRSIGAGAPQMQWTRDHSPKDQIREYFKGLDRDWKMIFFNVRTFLIQGNTVAVVCECAWKQRHTGKVVHTPKLDVFRVKKGEVVDFFEFFDNHQAYAACAKEGSWHVPDRPKALYKSGKSTSASGVTAASANNVKTLKKVYAKWDKTKGGSSDAFLDILAPSVHWGSLSQGAAPVAFTKTRRSRDEVKDYFRGLADSFTMNYYKANEYIAAGPYVLALFDISFTNKRTGKSFVSPKADLWRFSRGKATEFDEYYDTAAVMATA